MTLVAFTAAGAHVMFFSNAALAEDQEFSTATERQVLRHAPTAASDGLPVPALVGGVVLAFAVGIAGGQVHRRRRAVHRRSVASARPGPILIPPAKEKRAEAEPQPAQPAPAPPAPEPRVELPVDLSGPPRPIPAPPPPEPQPAPPRVVAPPTAPAPAAPAPPSREARPIERPREPLRLVQRPAPRPAVGAPLGEAPEVPRLEQPADEAAEPAIPLASAPETVLSPGASTRPPAVEPTQPPARRFARPVPWPEDAAELWTCEIAWRAGYRKSSFRAMAGPPGAGKRRPFGDSPSVRWTLMGEPEPPTPELALRVRALVRALEEAGWEHIGRGQLWYAQRFIWRGDGEPQPVAVPDVEPAER
jgi:hypothetical protein